MNSSITAVNIVEVPFEDWPGGEARLAHDLCLMQVRWGYRVYLVGKKFRGDLPDREEIAGVTVIRLPSNYRPPPDPRNMLERITATSRAVKRILAETGSIAILHTHTPLHALGAMREVAKTRTLKVHSIHSPWLLEMEAAGAWGQDRSLKGRAKSAAAKAAARFIEKRCFRGADFLTADSEFTRREIIREYRGVARDKSFQVLPGWVDTDRFSPDGPRTDWAPELGRKPRGPVFFTVRALVPRNGLDMLINASSLLKNQGLQFEVVIGGSGHLRDELEAQIKRLALDDHVKIIGRIEDERLPVLYRSCDAFVLPTIALECFGIIILEALASGKPVIATPVGSIPEVLGPIYPEGLLSEVSVQALAESMIKYYSKIKGQARPAGEAERLRNHVSQNFSTAIGTGRFRRIYESEPAARP
ncbi:MAG TPA: glycosyltransferase family 4 protein [bacterium]|nr:glycosyltransferase family 4 protein [bacterium]